MALARLNVPGILLYGGSILPGHYKGADVTILEVFEAVGAHAAGKITDDELRSWRRPRRPASAPAAASSPPTRWRWRSRCSACRRWARAMVPAAYEDKNRVATRPAR